MKRGIYACFFKRFFDILISFLAIVILLPVFIIIYLLSFVILKGNPIFKQYRPGKNGKIFPLYKFRSMTNKTDKNGDLLPDAERITKWGKLLRKTSLDELPQLINILVGDMSIVGPRPRLVKDMIFYDEEIMKAYSVRPGLTGPAQVYDRNSESSWESVFERDMEYAKNITFANDFKLFFGTFTAVFKGGSASGANSESDKQKREYYYADYLLKSKKISKKQYDEGHKLAGEIENEGKGVVTSISSIENEEQENKAEEEENSKVCELPDSAENKPENEKQLKKESVAKKSAKSSKNSKKNNKKSSK